MSTGPTVLLHHGVSASSGQKRSLDLSGDSNGARRQLNKRLRSLQPQPASSDLDKSSDPGAPLATLLDTSAAPTTSSSSWLDLEQQQLADEPYLGAEAIEQVSETALT